MRSSSRSIDGHRSLTDLLPSTLDVLIRLLLHLRWLSSASAPSAWYRDRSAHAGNLQKLPHRLYVPFFLSSLFRLQTPILNQRLLLQLADTPRYPSCWRCAFFTLSFRTQDIVLEADPSLDPLQLIQIPRLGRKYAMVLSALAMAFSLFSFSLVHS
jgi:hypothetical protein